MKWSTEKKILLGGGITLAVLLINALVSYRATNRLITNEGRVTHTRQVLTELEATLSTLKDAETGQRGFIITGQEPYLEPYETAVVQINEHVEKLRQLTADNPNQQARIPVLERNIAARLVLLEQGIELRKRGDIDTARNLIVAGEGKRLMDDLRQLFAVMENEENLLLAGRSEESRRSGRDAVLTVFIASLIAGSLLFLLSYTVIRDLTRRKEAEELLSQQREWLQVMLSSIGDAVIATDTKGSVSFINRVAQTLTGWKHEEALGQPLELVFNIVNEKTGEKVENPALRAIREGVIVGLANSTVLIAKYGTEVPIDDSGAPIKDANNKIIGAVLIFRDISERKQFDSERQQLLIREQEARGLAEQANMAKDEFLAMLSHELRSPLNAITGWTRLMTSGRLNEEQRQQAIEVIDRNVSLQNALIEDLLDVSRIVSGKMRLENETASLTLNVQAAVDAARPAAEKRQIKLESAIDPNANEIFGDKDRLQQAVGNLLSNAIKFTPEGGSIKVVLERDDANARLIVEDTGIGIAPDLLPLVFDRFKQADISSKRRYGGLGLGLTIVKNLIELHGGTVSAFSDGENRGSTFTVYLPLAEQTRSEAELKIPDDVGKEDDAGSRSLNDVRILLVDDEPDALEMMRFILEAEGARLTNVRLAREVLQELDGGEFDLLISDVGMPEMDGYELIRKVRESISVENLPAIALTGFASADDRARILEAGYQGHLPKPVNSKDLLMMILSVIHGTRSTGIVARR